VRALLSLLLLASTAAGAAAAGGGAGAPGAVIPWWDLFKQLVNFSILVGVLVYFLRKPLASFLKERSELLRKSIGDAARAREEAAAKLSAIEARMSGLADEIAGMSRKMDAEADEEARRIREIAEIEIERVRTQARFAAGQEVKKAREELRREAAGLSIRAAGEIVKRTITPEDQERLVRENIDKIREIMQ